MSMMDFTARPWHRGPTCNFYHIGAFILMCFNAGDCSVTINEFTAAQVGHNVTVTWEYTLPEQVAVLFSLIWTKGGTQLGTYAAGSFTINPQLGYGGRLEATVSDSQAEFTIKNFTSRDEGTFLAEFTFAISGGSQVESASTVIAVPAPPSPAVPTITGYSGGYVTPGSSLTLTCESTVGKPPSDLTWSRDGTELSASYSSTMDSTGQGDATSVLTTPALQQADNGAVYECRASQPALAQDRNSQVTVSVAFIKDTTAITGYTTGTAVDAGTSLTLTCTSGNSNPAATITWTRDGSPVNGTNNTEQAGSNGGKVTTQQLELRNLQPDSDNGTEVKCVAKNSGLSQTQEDTVTVVVANYGPRNVQVTCNSSDLSDWREGGALECTCTAESNPAARYSWTYGTAGSTPTGSLPTGAVEDETAGTLTFNTLNRTHTGDYRCTATNSISSATSGSITVDVKYPPSIISITPAVTVDEFDDVSLTCTVDSNPAPDSFSWTDMTDASLPGDFSNQGFTLTTTITNITYLQAGTYTCTAGNGIGDASNGTNVTVEYAPKFSPPSGPYAAAIGESVSMNCSAFAVPNKITFTWSKNGTTLTNSSRLTIQSSGQTSVLSISGVEEGDYGTYNCTSANEKGSSSTTRILQPLGIPDKPTGLRVVSKNAEFVVGITWDAGFNGGLATTHTVQLATAGGGQWEDVGSWEQTDSQQHLTFDVTLDLKAQEAGDYHIRIRARNSQGRNMSDPVDLKLEGNQILYGTLAITSKDYSEGVCDGELSNRIVAQLDSIFDSYKGYEGAEVTACRSGSVLADFEATVAKSEAAAAQDTYRDNLIDGELGEFTVDHVSSKISDTKPAGVGGDTTTIIIIAVVCGVVLIAGIVAGIFLVRRHATRDTLPTNSPTNMELERVPGDSDDGYQSLRMPKRQNSDHTYQGLTPRQENKETPEAAYEDVKAPSEFPRSQLNFTKELGQGEFGNVYKAEAWKISGSAGTATVAVKELKGMTSPAASTTFFKELSILKLLGTHPNVVSFLGCCTDTEPFYLLLEYVSGGSLQSTLRTSRTQQTYGNLHGGSKSLSSRDLTRFAWDVAKGMTFLSAKKILHRDLATRNVLVSADRTCKVSDFGFSREGDEYERTTKTRLPVRWMAPESLFHRKYTTKTDVWAFGVLLWEIVTLGATPYPGMSKHEVMDGVQQGYRMDKPNHCEDKIYSLMMQCWKEQPMERPGFPQLEQGLDALMEDEHGYINLAYFDENAYTSLQTSREEKF